MGGLRWRSHSGVKRRIKPRRGEKAESRQGFLSDGLKAGGVQGDEGHLENSTQRMAALWFFHVTQDTLEDQNTSLFSLKSFVSHCSCVQICSQGRG